MAMESLSGISYGLANTNANYGMKREFGQNVAPVNTAPNQNAYSAQIRTLPIEEQMEIALQLQEKELGVDGAHQASATSNPYSAKGPEWKGIDLIFNGFIKICAPYVIIMYFCVEILHNIS